MGDDRRPFRDDRSDEFARSKPRDLFDDRHSSRDDRSDESSRGKPRDLILKDGDRRSSRDEDDRRDRSFRDDDYEGGDHRSRSSREDRDLPGDRDHRGNVDSAPLRVSLEGENANQESMVKLVRAMATPEVMSVFQQSRLVESLKLRCSLTPGRSGNNVEEALSYERGAGILQTVAGVIAENLSMHFAPKLLDMLRSDPRSNWPLAQFSKSNLEKSGLTSKCKSPRASSIQGQAPGRWSSSGRRSTTSSNL